MNVEQSFKNVIGREMTPDEVTRYLKLQKEFEIPDTDPTWMIFIWFEFYQRIFEQFPSSTRAEVETVTRQLKEASATVIRSAAAEIEKTQTTAKSEIEALTARTKQEIAKALGQSMTGAVDKAIAQITESVAVQAAKAQARKWLSIGGGIVLTTILLTGGGTWYFTQKADKDAHERARLTCTEPGDQIVYSEDGKDAWCNYTMPTKKKGR